MRRRDREKRAREEEPEGPPPDHQDEVETQESRFRYEPKKKIKLDTEKKETDPNRIEARMKQIMKGKNTLGYERYLASVPRGKREKHHPRTPDAHTKVSKRCFDGLLRKWRRELHKWDPIAEGDATKVSLEQIAAEIQTTESPEENSIAEHVKTEIVTENTDINDPRTKQSNAATTEPKTIFDEFEDDDLL